jgi:hypothetical protein
MKPGATVGPHRGGAAITKFLPLCVVLLSLAPGVPIVSVDAKAATASDGAVRPASTARYCVIKHDSSSDQPKCYDNPIACVMAAIADAGSCTRQSRTKMTVGSGASSAVPLPRPRPRPRIVLRDDKLTPAQRDELFRDFVRWKDGSTSKTN